VTKTASPLEG